MSASEPDVILIGGGIMSAHLGVMLKRLEPKLKIEVFEAGPEVGRESSDGWNNAGTGHAGLCELNYTPPPAVAGGPVDVSKAVEIFGRFEQSRQFWRHAVESGIAPRPGEFIRAVPHLSFVRGAEAGKFLKERHAALVAHPFFRAMEFTTKREVLREWVPLMVEGRAEEAIAATRVEAGTDVNFGELSRQLLAWLGTQAGCRVSTGMAVTGVVRARVGGGWEVAVREVGSGAEKLVRAGFLFVGAGGGTIPLLRGTGLPVGRGLGAFPIAGQWLVCERAEVVARHRGKVYGPPPRDSGALGGSHLDLRHIGGRRALLFGPFASWTSKFLQQTGRVTDLPYSLRHDNAVTLARTGLRNPVLVKFLLQQGVQSMEARLRALRVFYPEARAEDWRLVDAGIRVQALKKTDGGRLYFGTEVVTAPDGTLAALLGASPGASVSANIAVQVVQRCFGEWLKTPAGFARMKEMIPTFDVDLGQVAAAKEYVGWSGEIDAVLGLESRKQP